MSRLVLLGAGATAEAGVPATLEMTDRFLSLSRMDTSEPIVQYVLHYVTGVLYGSQIRFTAEPKKVKINVEVLIRTVKMLAERIHSEVEPFVAMWQSPVLMLDKAIPSHQVRGQLVESLRIMNEQAAGLTEPNFEMSADNIHQINLILSLDQGGGFWRSYFWMLKQLFTLTYIDHPSRVSYMDSFVKNAHRTGVAIATLNYDNAIESVCAAMDIPCDNGMGAWVPSKTLHFEDGSLKYLKLHGSILWAKSWASGVAANSNDWGALKPNVDELRTGVSFPEIVFGDRSKLVPEGPMLQLFEEFRRELFDSDQLVVVGYSFGDPHVNAVISSWLSTDSRRTLQVYDKAPGTQPVDTLAGFLRPQAESQIFVSKRKASTILPRLLD